MAIAPGDRVELVATDDPYTILQSGDRGTVTGIRDVPERAIDIAWDNGSTLSILPDAGDRIRKLAHDPVPPLQLPNDNSNPLRELAPPRPIHHLAETGPATSAGCSFAQLGDGPKLPAAATNAHAAYQAAVSERCFAARGAVASMLCPEFDEEVSGGGQASTGVGSVGSPGDRR